MNDWIPVKSSNLKQVRYNSETEELDIIFHNNETSFYRYSSVPIEKYKFLVNPNREDVGWYFWRVLRNSYPCTRIDFNESEDVVTVADDGSGNEEE